MILEKLETGKAIIKSSNIMTKNAVTVSPEEPIFEVQSVLHYKISRVVTKNKTPLRIVTHRHFILSKTFHLSYQFADHNEISDMRWSPIPTDYNVNVPNYLLTFSANNVMTKDPHIIHIIDPVYTAAILIIRNHISRLPVVKNDRQLQEY